MFPQTQKTGMLCSDQEKQKPNQMWLSSCDTTWVSTIRSYHAWAPGKTEQQFAQYHMKILERALPSSETACKGWETAVCVVVEKITHICGETEGQRPNSSSTWCSTSTNLSCMIPLRKQVNWLSQWGQILVTLSHFQLCSHGHRIMPAGTSAGKSEKSLLPCPPPIFLLQMIMNYYVPHHLIEY